MNEIKSSKASFELMKGTQKAWNESYSDREGDIPSICFKVGFRMCFERTIKNKMTALQFDWDHWQPRRSGQKPYKEFIDGYTKAAEL